MTDPAWLETGGRIAIKKKRRFIMESMELEVTGTVGAMPIVAPPPPASASVVIPDGTNVAQVSVILQPPAVGQPPLTAVEIFHDAMSHAGESADQLRAAGLVAGTVPVNPGDASVELSVPDLPWGTEVFFDIFQVA